jgi:putative heme iron utilization protein
MRVEHNVLILALRANPAIMITRLAIRSCAVTHYRPLRTDVEADAIRRSGDTRHTANVEVLPARPQVFLDASDEPAAATARLLRPRIVTRCSASVVNKSDDSLSDFHTQPSSDSHTVVQNIDQ